MRGTVAAVRDSEVVVERFGYYLRRNLYEGRYFGVRVGRNGRAGPGDLARAAARLVMVCPVLKDAYRGSGGDVTDQASRRVL